MSGGGGHDASRPESRVGPGLNSSSSGRAPLSWRNWASAGLVATNPSISHRSELDRVVAPGGRAKGAPKPANLAGFHPAKPAAMDSRYAIASSVRPSWTTCSKVLWRNAETGSFLTKRPVAANRFERPPQPTTPLRGRAAWPAGEATPSAVARCSDERLPEPPAPAAASRARHDGSACNAHLGGSLHRAARIIKLLRPAGGRGFCPDNRRARARPTAATLTSWS